MAVTQHAAAGVTPPHAAGANLLLSDLRLTFLLLDEARYRSLERIFGCSRDQANLITLVIGLTLAQGLQDQIRHGLRAPGLPSPMDGLFAAVGARGVVSQIAGAPTAGIPGAGTLLTIAIVAGAFGPSLRRSLRALRALRSESQRLSADFHRRYGYLVDLGHWRERRARTRVGLIRPEASRPSGSGRSSGAARRESQQMRRLRAASAEAAPDRPW